MANDPNSLPYPRCLGDRLLVQPLPVETTVGGMIRPGAADERPVEGIVVLVGPGRFTDLGQRIPVEISEGDLISFPSYAGKEIVDPRGFADGTYLIVRQDEVQLNYGHHMKHLLPNEFDASGPTLVPKETA